jgi:hypothetical protein
MTTIPLSVILILALLSRNHTEAFRSPNLIGGSQPIIKLSSTSNRLALTTVKHEAHQDRLRLRLRLRLSAGPSSPMTTPSALYVEPPHDREEKFNRDAVYGDSEKRGAIVFGFSLLLVVWSFTIPVEFRRAYFCTSDPCVEHRATCKNCVTLEEWTSEIGQFYKSTPPIQWVKFDFSIDPNTPFKKQ